MSTLQVNTIENRSGERFDLGGGNKNLLINGGMNIWQRQITAAVSGGYKTADRWQTDFSSLGGFTQSRSTDVPSGQGFSYSLKMDCTSADTSPAASDKLIIIQRIEGQNLQHLQKSTSSAKKMTLSFWVKSNKTGTYVVKFETTGGRFISKTYTINSSSTWEKKTITVEGDTGGSAIANDYTEGLSVQWWLGAGANYTLGLNGSWDVVTENLSASGQVNLADSTSNEWYMTGCQLEVGSQATNFEFEPFETVLRKCERYYEHSFHEGQFEGAVTTSHCWHTNSFSSSDDNCPGPFFRVVKRDTPVVRLYSSSLNVAGQISSGGTPRTATAANITTRYVSYISVVSGTGLTYCRYNYAAESELS